MFIFIVVAPSVFAQRIEQENGKIIVQSAPKNVPIIPIYKDGKLVDIQPAMSSNASNLKFRQESELKFRQESELLTLVKAQTTAIKALSNKVDTLEERLRKFEKGNDK
jgi:hypothetical protein